MRDDPDPERSEGVADRLDARHYGDPEGERPPHVAPPDVEDVTDREDVEQALAVYVDRLEGETRDPAAVLAAVESLADDLRAAGWADAGDDSDD